VDRAQAIADALSPDMLHERLDRYAQWLCPVLDVFGQTYHWSLRQAEYSTDLMFRSQQTLVPLYDVLSRQAVLAAHAGKVAGFLGKKVTPQLAQEIGSRLSTRIEGRCIKHHMGVASVKVYDKFSHVLRIETTINDVSFFKHHRKVEHKNGQSTYELAALRKTIYSLIDLREIMLGCNQSRVGSDERRVKGLNFFDGCEQALLRALQRGEFNVHGLRRADLARHVDMSASVLSRQLSRLRTLGLIKKVAHTYRYYLTRLGRAAIAAACSLTRFNIVPVLAAAH